MEHRIRAAMDGGELPPLGGEGEIVEIDETFIDRKEGYEKRQGAVHKNAIMTLLQRGGSARSFHVGGINAKICPRSSKPTLIAKPIS